MPIIQPNNTTGLYGVDTTVTINNAVTGNSLNIQGNGSISGNLTVGGQISAVGNVSGNYIIGNGSQLTGVVGTYSNAQVSAYLASGTNTANIITTGNISGTYILGNGSQLSGLPELYGNANVSNYLASGTNTANIVTQANVVGSVLRTAGANGNIQGANYISGNAFIGNTVSVVGNVTGSFFLGNGSQLTGIAASYSDANVTTLLASLGPNIISSTGNITTTANISGNYILGNGSQLTGLPATYGNANVTTLLASFGSNTISSTGNITTTANVNGGNVNAFAFSASGNISTGAFFIGDGSQLTNLPAPGAPGGNTTEIQFNDGGTFAGNSLFTWDSANTRANIGNVSIQGSIINNTNAFNANLSPNPFRVIYGNGYNGDYSSTGDPLGVVRNAQLTVQTKQTSTSSDTNPGVRGYSGLTYNDLNGQTHTNNARRGAGSGSVLWLGNGTIAMTGTQYLGASGAGGTLVVGNIGTVSMGNATVGHATGAVNLVISGGGANIGNAAGVLGQIQTQSANAIVTTAIGVGTSFTAVGGAITVPPTTVIGYYMPNNTVNYGLSSGNPFRSATNYYFLKNDDNAAQSQMGSLRAYHEFEAQTATSGSFAIDKNVAQVHNIVPVGNCTITGYNNMVVSASDGTNNDPQIDTLTIIVEQGATPYTVTLPTGAAFKYAGGNSTVGTTANAVTIVTVVAANVSGTTTYMTTVSPEFV
jgi:hypothetical protein